MLSAEELKELERKASQALVATGAFIMEHWLDPHNISYKNERDSATEIDVQAEEMLRKALTEIYPSAGFIVEEGQSTQGDEYSWVIDPIDGTKQFVSQMPLFNTQFALLYKNEPVMGAIYNPVSKQLFSASKGCGVRINGIDVHPTIDRPASESIIDIDFGGNTETLGKRMQILEQLISSFYRVRMFAGIFGNYMTTGALDGTLTLGRINIYDYAPHDIVETEAGIRVEYFEVQGIGKIRIAGFPKAFEKIKEITSSLNE
jgi:fructose-1,6-bisphosphatase/inositol monophosphatase family enzyme